MFNGWLKPPNNRILFNDFYLNIGKFLNDSNGEIRIRIHFLKFEESGILVNQLNLNVGNMVVCYDLNIKVGIRINNPLEDGVDMITGKPSKQRVVFARAY
ncbi:MAG: hypothetical protein J6T60_10725 [Bacteroidales bacterium]|nr:hypothetical protein [Bacteroidales bacterium]